MTYTTDNQQTVFYTLVAVLTTVALILVMCKQSGTAAAVSSISILAIVVEMTMRQKQVQGGAVVVSGGSGSESSSASGTRGSKKKTAAMKAAKKVKAKREQAASDTTGQGEETTTDTTGQAEETTDTTGQGEETTDTTGQGEETTGQGEETTDTTGQGEETTTDTTGQEGVSVDQTAEPVAASMSARRRPKRKSKVPSARYSADQIADVPGNEYVGHAETRHLRMREPPRMAQECSSAKLVLPITMEGEEPYGWRPEDYGGDNLTSCNGGIKTVPPLPPMPGLALPPPTGESIWRLPENVVDQCSREESIAAVVSGLPTCCQQTPMEAIRNQGLYGVKGNLSCDKLKRSTVADYNLLEPLGARNAFLAYNSYDQLHAKDQFMIPINKEQPE